MKHVKVENVVDLGDGNFLADVTFVGIGKVPFNCTPYDTEEHGKNIYKEIVEGKWGAPVGIGRDEAALNAQHHSRMRRNHLLGSTQWMVDRHRDELELSIQKTSLSKVAYSQLLVYRKALRDWPSSDRFPSGEPVQPAFMQKETE